MTKIKYYIIRRLLLLFLVFILVSTITFILSHVVPGNPAVLWAGPHATKEMIERATRELELDKPVHIQYIIWLQKIIRGDFGTSILTRRPVIMDLMDYFPATFELTTVSMIIALLIGIPLGIFSAVKKDELIDHVSRVSSLTGVSFPIFLLGMLLQLTLGYLLGLFPLSGRISPGITPARITGLYLIDTLIAGDLHSFINVLHSISLPALTLSLAILGMITRITRASMLDVLEEDYIRTARSMGLPNERVLYKYALRNALLPVVTMSALTYGYLLGGMILVEAIFDWPGIGYYISSAIIALDYPAIMGSTILLTVIFIIVNLIADIVYAILDPRIRY